MGIIGYCIILSTAEFQKGFFRQLMFAELDEDGDGVISKEEMREVFAQFHTGFDAMEGVRGHTPK